jgi:hypothetical protein
MGMRTLKTAVLVLLAAVQLVFWGCAGPKTDVTMTGTWELSRVDYADGTSDTAEELLEAGAATPTIVFSDEKYMMQGAGDELLSGLYVVSGGTVSLHIGKDSAVEGAVEGDQFSLTLMDVTWTYVKRQE